MRDGPGRVRRCSEVARPAPRASRQHQLTAGVGLTVEEFQPAPALRGVVHRAVDFHENAAPLRRLESPLAGLVLIVSLGLDMEIDGRATGSFVAGVWDRPTVTGHYGEQAGYQLYLDLIDAR